MKKYPFVIAVCHQKGGVGKTTTVSSLGAALAEIRLQVLAVDLDTSANLTTGLGITPSKVVKSAADILLGNDTLQNIYQKTSIKGLNLIPSNSDIGTASRFLYLRRNYEHLFKDVFTREGNKFDVILLDCPPNLNALTLSALTAADLAIIPLQCEYYSLQALDNVLDVIKITRERTNPRLSYRLLITMFDRRGKFHTRILEQIKEYFPGALFNTYIGFDSKLRESQLFGRPITIHATSTRAAQQYRQLAREVLDFAHNNSLKEMVILTPTR